MGSGFSVQWTRTAATNLKKSPSAYSFAKFRPFRHITAAVLLWDKRDGKAEVQCWSQVPKCVRSRQHEAVPTEMSSPF